MKTIAFFNNKGGVGKTTLVYHLAWMFAELGYSVIAADLDPQANLTSMFVDEEALEELWPEGDHAKTVFGAIRPLLVGIGDVVAPHVEPVAERIGLLVGDLALSASEGELSQQWPNALDRNPRSFRVLSALWRVIEMAARANATDIVLIDVGPNLGALNRMALIAAQHVVIPLAPDLHSLQGLRNLGPTLRRWREEWQERHARNPAPEVSIPTGEMVPAGYVVMQHSVRLDRPVKAYERWMARIPRVYRESVFGEVAAPEIPSVENDPQCLARLKHYRSLMPMAQEARKPMFLLKAADGAIGSHGVAARNCYADFQALARMIAERCAIPDAILSGLF